MAQYPITTGCKGRLDYFQSLGYNYTDGYVQSIIDGFNDNPSHVMVYKNYDYNKLYDSCIYSGNKKDTIVGYKKFVSYPYDIRQFTTGDYIHWKYNGVDLSTWLIVSLDMQYIYNLNGRIMLCNNKLKKLNAKQTDFWTKDCVFIDSIISTNPKDPASEVSQIAGNISVWVQIDSDTSAIKFNDRFIFNGCAFQVKQINKHIDNKLMKLDLMTVLIQTNDDLVNNVANGLVIGNSQESVPEGGW